MFLFRLARALLLLAAVAFAALGTFSMWRPAQVLSGVGIKIEGVDARTEVRATYGGLQLALALVFAVTGRSPKLWLGGVALLWLMMGGLLAGRLVSYLADGPPGRMTMFLAAFETTLWLPCSLILVVCTHIGTPEPPK
jgi:hypothetical protein